MLTRIARFSLAVFLAHTALATDLCHVDLHQAGSATIIRQPTATGIKTIVVDTGNQRGGTAVLKKLHGLNVDHIDLLIITHLDKDHYGGYASLLKLPGARSQLANSDAHAPRGPPITRVLQPNFEKTNQSTEAFAAALNEHNIKVITPADREECKRLEQEFDIRTLAAPNPCTTNCSSLLITIHESTFTKGTHVITGDLTAKSWKSIEGLLPRSRVLSLTAPHHGGDPLLVTMMQALKPEVIVISANKNNQYRHPSLRVMRALAQASYLTTPDLHELEYRARQATIDAAADREYLEELQAYYRLNDAALHPDSEVRRIAAVEKLRQSSQTVRSSPTHDVLSRRIRITGEHGTVMQTGAWLPEPRTFREIVIEEAIYRSVARLTDQEVAILQTWSNAQSLFRARAEYDLYTLWEYFSGTRRELPGYVDEYARIVMDLRQLSREDAITSALREIASSPSARPRRVELPILLPDRTPIEELRQRFAEQFPTGLKQTIEVRLPSERGASTQVGIVPALTPGKFRPPIYRTPRTAELLPKSAWDPNWHKGITDSDGIARRGWVIPLPSPSYGDHFLRSLSDILGQERISEHERIDEYSKLLRKMSEQRSRRMRAH